MKKIILILLTLFVPIYSCYSEGWESKLLLGSSLYKGNVDKFDFRTEGNISHADLTFEYSTAIKIVYGEINSEKTNQELQGGIKFDYRPYDTLSPFVAFSVYNNEFKDIKLRISSLAGVKYTFYETKTSDFSISVAGLHDYEEYKSSHEKGDIVRASIRPKFTQKISDKATISNITFYKIGIEDTNDYLIETTTSLTNQLIGRVNLNLGYEYNYDNEPRKSVKKKHDSAFITSIILKF